MRDMSEPGAEYFARLAYDLQAEPDTEATVDVVVEYARDAVKCDGAGVHLLEGKRIRTAASTGELVRQADDLQNELGEGPCLSSIESLGSYVVPDSANDPRWPVYGPRLARLGYRSMVSVPLVTKDSVIGSLNLFSVAPHSLDATDEAVARIFARHASIALANARSEDNLEKALDGRKAIGQAQGILMERFRIDEGRAFSLLRRYSQHHNTKLVVVAQDVISGGLFPALPDAGEADRAPVEELGASRRANGRRPSASSPSDERSRLA
ncbi:ANTAR domain-containing protein [Labedella phragmitis]|uniref:ANTAR domain-containing protein n=1 Tax=Labedella phragmitis TaxID=2498849 RepID=A0A3S4BK70_9MICO|nr:ANTAR domain-containing protein [Labedella phragmitis]